MKVAVVIPSYYEADAEYLKVCVESLRATTDWDIVVVTNGTKGKPNLGNIDGVTRHIHTSDQGQGNAVNIGVQTVAPDTDYIFISNSDMYYAPGWNDRLLFDHMCFSPNLVEPTNNNGSADPFLKYDGGFTLDEFSKGNVDMYVKAKIDSMKVMFKGNFVKNEEVGLNFPVFIKKELWDTIGGYDIAYDPWGSNSDTDLQTKVELAGVTPIRILDVLVYHFSNKSGTFDGTHQDYWQNNWDYYLDKWGFDRDTTGGDPWYCKNMIDYDALKYHPSWKGKYSGK